MLHRLRLRRRPKERGKRNSRCLTALPTIVIQRMFSKWKTTWLCLIRYSARRGGRHPRSRFQLPLQTGRKVLPGGRLEWKQRKSGSGFGYFEVALANSPLPFCTLQDGSAQYHGRGRDQVAETRTVHTPYGYTWKVSPTFRPTYPVHGGKHRFFCGSSRDFACATYDARKHSDRPGGIVAKHGPGDGLACCFRFSLGFPYSRLNPYSTECFEEPVTSWTFEE